MTFTNISTLIFNVSPGGRHVSGCTVDNSGHFFDAIENCERWMSSSLAKWNKNLVSHTMQFYQQQRVHIIFWCIKDFTSSKHAFFGRLESHNTKTSKGDQIWVKIFDCIFICLQKIKSSIAETRPYLQRSSRFPVQFCWIY